MVREFVVDRVRSCVVQRVFKNGARDARVFVVKRDEWIPADESDIEGNGWVGKSDFSEGILTAEVAFCESWEALESAAAKALPLQALIEDLERGEGSLDKPRYRRSALDVDHCECSLR